MSLLRILSVFILVCEFTASVSFGVSEADFSTVMQSQVLPFFDSTVKNGEFKGEENFLIRYKVFLHPAPKASVVVVTGAFENMRKYAELTYDLYQNGYSVFLLDHRGQGYSERLLADPFKLHMDRFDYLVKDLKTYVETIVKPQATGPLLILGHSMGGAVTARYLELFPDDFASAVLSAPMLEIDLGNWSEWAAGFTLGFLSFIGQWDEYQGTPQDPLQRTFGDDSLTHSQMRFEQSRSVIASEPELRLFGPTKLWVREALKGSRQTRADAAKVKTPVLLLQAGADTLVLPGGQNTFCQHALSCTLEIFPNARHEILVEEDGIRGPALEKILAHWHLSAQ